MNVVFKGFFIQSVAVDWKDFHNIFQNPADSKAVPAEVSVGIVELGSTYPGEGTFTAAAIENDAELIYSAPIITGFFPADDADGPQAPTTVQDLFTLQMP